MNRIAVVQADSTHNEGHSSPEWPKWGELMAMIHNQTPIYKKDIDTLIAKFTEVLNLYMWDIKWRLVDDEKMVDSLMKVIPTRTRNSAVIHISKSLIGKPTAKFAPLLLHEMLHLVIDKITEEYETQAEYELDSSRLVEYNARFIACLEKAVDHLARAVYVLVELPEVSNMLPDSASDLLKGLSQSLIKLEEDKAVLQDAIKKEKKEVS